MGPETAAALGATIGDRSVGRTVLAEAEPIPGAAVTATVATTDISRGAIDQRTRRCTAASLAALTRDLAAPYRGCSRPGRLGRNG